MSNRIVGLDLLRAIIMLFGPTYHASMLMEGYFGFDGYFLQTDVVRTLLLYTNQFRMELFFVISGFFSSLVIERKGAEHYENSRKDRILKPTILSILIILPLTCILMYFLQSYKDFDGYFSYRHLWFLVTLSMISLVTLINPVFFVNLAKKIASLLNGRSVVFCFALFCFSFFVFHIASAAIYRILPEKVNLIFQVENTVKYFLPFSIGMILYFSEINLSRKGSLLLVFVFSVWYVVSSVSSTYSQIPKIIQFFSKDVFSTLMCISIFYLFFNLKVEKNRIISDLSKVALPFYLLHLPILIFLSGCYARLVDSKSDIVFSMIVIPLTIIFSYIFSKLLMKINFASKALGLA